MVRELLGLVVCAAWCIGCGDSERNGQGPGGGSSAAGAGSGGSSGSGGNQAAGGSDASAGSGGGTAGSGSSTCPGTTNHTPGSRLRPQFVVSAEGDRNWNGWWDTALNAPCSFNTLSDGSWRCLPNNWNLSEEVFTDASCTQALYTRMRISDCETADYVMLLQGAQGCDIAWGYDLYELGAAATPATVYRKAPEGGCVEGSAPGEALFQRGPAVPASTFVEATPGELGGSTRLRGRGVSAADGTRQVFGWQDSGLDGLECHFGRAADGELRCLPDARAGSAFSDAACSSPVIIDSRECIAEALPAYASVWGNFGCTDEPLETVALGAAFTGQQYGPASETAPCEPMAAPEPRPTHATTPAPAATFASVEHVVDETDPGRLKARSYVADDGGCWFHDFWDSELEVACSFAPAADGQQRCLPHAAMPVMETFSDAACTQPSALATPGDCTAPPPDYVSTAKQDGCSNAFTIWRTGEAVLGSALPPLFTLAGTTCVPWTVPAPSASYLRLTLVEPSAFMPGELMVE